MLIKKIKSKIQDRKLSVGLQQEQRQCVQHQNAATMDDQPLVEEPKWHKKFSMYSFSSLALRKDRHQRKSSPFQHSLSMPQFSSVAEEAPQQSSELNHSLSVAVNAASGSVGGDSSSSSRETSSIPLAERRPSSITVQTTCTSSTNALRRPFSCSAVESISIPDILVALRNAVEEEVDAASITSSRVGDPGITCAHKHPQHQTRQTSSDGDSGEDSNNWRSSGCTVAVNHENIRSLLKMNMEEETLPANAGTVGANALENIPSEYHVDEKADETNEEQSNICLEKDRSATADDHIRNCSMHECNPSLDTLCIELHVEKTMADMRIAQLDDALANALQDNYRLTNRIEQLEASLVYYQGLPSPPLSSPNSASSFEYLSQQSNKRDKLQQDEVLRLHARAQLGLIEYLEGQHDLNAALDRFKKQLEAELRQKDTITE